MVDALCGALCSADDIEVVGITHAGTGVMELVEEHRPDVVLLDGRMPGLDGLTCLQLIRQAYPDIKVVMVSASEDPRQIAQAFDLGASAYIGKRINPADLASAIRQVFDGAVYHHSAVPGEDTAPRASTNTTDLTERERTMLEAISRGLSTKAISRELWISEKTVKFHLTNIYRKLGVHNRTGAMRYAYENGLVTAPPPDHETIADLARQ